VPGVVTATFTGKAALVLRRKGTPAQTIHSLIYSVLEATEQELETLRKEIEADEQNARGITDTFDRITAESRIEYKRQELSKMKRPRFARNPQSDAAHCELIVLDEVSMVGPEMAADLLSFKKPILVLGDPGQLPPIKGEGAFTQQEPDVMLTEIHRQAEESAIIRLATMARNGDFIPFGQHDSHVAKMHKGAISPAQMLRGGQLICGKNATRFQLNNDMRHAAGFRNGILPSGPNEKIICLKNQNDMGLINGMFVTLENVVDEDDAYFSALVKNDQGEYVGVPSEKFEPSPLRIYKGHFFDHVEYDHQRNDRDWRIKRGLTEATFGWAITCHKAQGSQWENVIVWDDGLGRSESDRRCWLYTAITRAEKGLVLLG
jgi:exodeoxyribonuclease-5